MLWDKGTRMYFWKKGKLPFKFYLLVLLACAPFGFYLDIVHRGLVNYEATESCQWLEALLFAIHKDKLYFFSLTLISLGAFEMTHLSEYFRNKLHFWEILALFNVIVLAIIVSFIKFEVKLALKPLAFMQPYLVAYFVVFAILLTVFVKRRSLR